MNDHVRDTFDGGSAPPAEGSDATLSERRATLTIR
jgi:hypothetical protein